MSDLMTFDYSLCLLRDFPGGWCCGKRQKETADLDRTYEKYCFSEGDVVVELKNISALFSRPACRTTE